MRKLGSRQRRMLRIMAVEGMATWIDTAEPQKGWYGHRRELRIVCQALVKKGLMQRDGDTYTLTSPI